MNTLTNEAIKSRIEALKNTHAQNNGAIASTYLADATAFEELLSLRAQLASLPTDWSKDSSLETWFPLSAEHIARLEAQLAELWGQAKPVCIVEESDYLTAEEMVGNKPRRKAVRELFEGALVVGAELFAHPVPPAASRPSYRDGIEAAAKWLDKQRESFDNEHGRHDPDTGTFEYGNDAQLEYSSTLAELAEGIRALHSCPASQPALSDELPGGLKYSSALPEFEDDSNIIKAYHCYVHGVTRSVPTQEQAYADAKAVCAALSQPYTVPDDISIAEALKQLKKDPTSSPAVAYKHGWRDRSAAMLQSGNSPMWSGVDWAKGCGPVVPDGMVLVPRQIFLDASDIESICSQCGDGGENYGEFTEGVLWVGDIQDDEGNVTHGLHISSADYPEEGGITLAEFAAVPRKDGDA